MTASGAVEAGTTEADEDRVFAALASAARREVLRLLRDGGRSPSRPWPATSTCGARACPSI